MGKVIYKSDGTKVTETTLGNYIIEGLDGEEGSLAMGSVYLSPREIDGVHAAIHPEYGKSVAPRIEPEPVEADCCWNCTLFTPGEDKDPVVCNRYPLERYFYDVNPRKKYCGEHRRKDA